MTRDALHARLYALQKRYLGWLPYPIREALSGVALIPLLYAAMRWPGAVAFAGFFAGSLAYEFLLDDPDLRDVLWRQVGALLVWGAWRVLT